MFLGGRVSSALRGAGLGWALGLLDPKGDHKERGLAVLLSCRDLAQIIYALKPSGHRRDNEHRNQNLLHAGQHGLAQLMALPIKSKTSLPDLKEEILQ